MNQPHHHAHILIVDDKKENLFAMENILKSSDLTIVKATSGNEALAQLLETDFACIILDVQMPEMDGFELANIIRTDERTRLVPIIFSSGHQRGEADVFKGYETGAVDYLMKPLDPTIVRSKVKVFADLYRKSAALTVAEAAMTKYANELKKSNDELEQRVADRMKELTIAQAQAAQLQKMDAIGSLAGGVAHDFNNLLAAITMYCDLVADFAETNEKVIKAVDEIRNVAARGAALTRQLLVFSRKQIVQPQSIELNVVVNGMLNMLRRLIGKNIEIVTQLEKPLRAICADPGQIEQVVLNLVVNARDAMPNGGTVTITTSNVVLEDDRHTGLAAGPHVVLSVTDTGSGMDEATRSHLFEPFFTTKPVGKGTGLGLSTAYGIIKQSKGSIAVTSELGRGATFKIFLPVTETPLTKPRALSKAPVKTDGATILLVEDDENLRALYKEALERHSYTIITAANGKEALEVISRQGDGFGLVLTDVMMPQMGGFELAQNAAKLRAGLPILLMSGYTNERVNHENQAALQKVHFIQKPFNTDDLVLKIQEVLGGAQPATRPS